MGKYDKLSLGAILDPFTYIKKSEKGATEAHKICQNYLTSYYLVSKSSQYECMNINGSGCQDCKNYKQK